MFGSDRVFCAVSCGFNLDLCPFYTKLRLFERLHNLVRVPGVFPRLCIFNFVLFFGAVFLRTECSSRTLLIRAASWTALAFTFPSHPLLLCCTYSTDNGVRFSRRAVTMAFLLYWTEYTGEIQGRW